MVLTIISGKGAEKYNGIKFPDSEVHPNDFLNLTKKLILISKVFNITVITYNPIFIECIDAWSVYLKIDVIYYLIKNDTKKEISCDKLYKIYNDLGEVYDKTDILHLLAEQEDNTCNCF